MKYFKKYNTTEKYHFDKGNTDSFFPNISYVKSNNIVYYNSIPESCEVKLIDLSDDNNNLVFNEISGHKVNVTYNRVLSATNNGDGTQTPRSFSVCLPYDFNISNYDVKLYQLQYVSDIDKKMYFEQVTSDIIYAAHPYVIVVNSGTINFDCSDVEFLSNPINKEVFQYENKHIKVGNWCGTFNIIDNNTSAEIKAHTLSNDGKFRRISNQPGYQGARVGTFRAFFSPYESSGYYVFTPVYYHNYLKDYLTIVSLEDNNVIKWVRNGNLLRIISISTDNGKTWSEKISSESGTTLATLNTGDKLLIKGNNKSYAISHNDYSCFASVGNFDIEGNIMSLVYGDNFIEQTTLDSSGSNFERLFNNCTKLISAENLILPTTTLTNNCYAYMFNGCTSLTTAPELPAITLVENCYAFMFDGCENLNYIKALFTTDPNTFLYTQDWVNGVAATGTFVKNSTANWDFEGNSGIPINWTVEISII